MVMQDEISSPINAQILEFCESDLFPEALQDTEVASTSNCCYEEPSSYANNLPLNTSQEINKISNTNISSTNTTKTTSTPQPNDHTNNLPLVFVSSEDIDNDISASIRFSPSPQFSMPSKFLDAQQQEEETFDISLLHNELGINDAPAVEAAVLPQYAGDLSIVPPLFGPNLPPLHEEDCLPSMPNCSFLDLEINSYIPSNINVTLPSENCGGFNGSMFMGTELQPQELDYQGDNGGIFCAEPLQPQVYNSDLQVLEFLYQNIFVQRKIGLEAITIA